MFCIYDQYLFRPSVFANELLSLSRYHSIPDPFNPRIDNNLNGYAAKLREERIAEDPSVLKNPRHLTGYRNSPEFLEYEALCRGEKTKVLKTVFNIRKFSGPTIIFLIC